MTKINLTLVLEKTTQLYAAGGQAGFSIRSLAKSLGVAPSVIYHYFPSEDALLRAMFDTANRDLGRLRSELIQPQSAIEMLRQRIDFQLTYVEKIVAVLKYYLAFRHTFSQNKQGFVPDKSALHIEEVLTYGKQTGEFKVDDIAEEAKVITHAINGFLLEYYPHQPQGNERADLINRISRFLIKALKGGETK